MGTTTPSGRGPARPPPSPPGELERLRDAHARLAGLVALATDAIISTDADLRITLFNHGAEQVFGYAAHEVLGRRLELLLPGRYRETHGAAVAEFSASPVSVRRMGERGRITAVRRGGEEFPAEASISRLVVAGETVLNVVLRDVSESRRVERELVDAVTQAQEARAAAEAAERRARFLADASVELAASLDYEATLAAVTRMAVPALADFCMSRVVGEDGDLRLVHAAHADPAREALLLAQGAEGSPTAQIAAAMDRVLETGRAETGSGAGEGGGDAALTPRSWAVAPLRARGRTLGAITLVYADSGRRYTAAELALVEALADRAAVAVDNARLYAAACRATRMRDETLRVVAHDMGNSLSAARLHAGLCARLLRGGGDSAAATAREHVLQISGLTTQLQRLRQDLLDAASLEAGVLALRPAPVEVGELVDEALERIAPLAAEKGLTVTAAVGDELPLLVADMERLLQVLGNLLGNAVKFTPAGGAVGIRAEEVAGGVRIEVSDTGPGIAPADLPHVFDRFWRAPGARGLGSGLGLAIARGIVDAHGGTLDAESAPGSGTRFRLTVPLRSPEA